MAKSLKLSSTLVFYWQDGQLTCEDYLRRQKFAMSPEVMRLLGQFSVPRNPAKFNGDSAMVARVKKMGLLVEHGSKQAEPLNGWHWGPAARHFFFGTKNAHVQRSKAERIAYAEALLKQSKQPPPFKEYPKMKGIRLSRPQKSEIADALSRVRDVRDFERRPISKEQLSQILLSAFGVHGRVDAGPFGALPVKSHHSAGNRYPLEVYPVVTAVDGLAKGLYHYNVKRDSLEFLKPGDFRRAVKAIANHQSWVKNAAVYLLITAIPERTSFKYRHDYFLRAIFAEVGSVIQSINVSAAQLNLGACATYTLRHGIAEKFLEIDGIRESFLALSMVGCPKLNDQIQPRKV